MSTLDFEKEYLPGDTFDVDMCPVCNDGLHWDWYDSSLLRCCGCKEFVIRFRYSHFDPVIEKWYVQINEIIYRDTYIRRENGTVVISGEWEKDITIHGDIQIDSKVLIDKVRKASLLI